MITAYPDINIENLDENFDFIINNIKKIIKLVKPI